MKILIEQIKLARARVNFIGNRHQTTIENLKENFANISSIFSDFESGWAGEWMNDNFNHYFDEFNPSKRERYQLDMHYLRNVIEKQKGINPTTLINISKPILKDYEALRDEIVTEFLLLKEFEKFKTEIDLLKQIEEFEFGFTRDQWIEHKKPKSFFVRGGALGLMNKGIIGVPPHLALEGEVMSVVSELNSLDKLVKLINRLIRQIEIRRQMDVSSSFDKTRDTLRNLFDKFHSIVKQLRNRHDNRSTITISDEYDVQDLIHALLKMDFDDVRPEEYTPSYAGSSSRVDFLLKNERIVIEIKKTRSSLKDKEIGNQLILDIAKYKSHPDCDQLICFVYDPEGLIVNPRGLENDLVKNSSEELLVEVYIKP